MEDFPTGITNVPVQSGQLLGYQGSWSGTSFWTKWVHVSFAVVDGSEQNNFPEKNLLDTILNSIPYLGLTLETVNENLQPLKCE